MQKDTGISMGEASTESGERLTQQIRFLLELDRLKNVVRQSTLLDGSRKENSAEHSWHVTMMAIVLAEHATTAVDIQRVVQMLLIHDVVEIDAGDTFAYDVAAVADQSDRENKAAIRIFRLLPEEQAEQMLNLWQEFEARMSPEAKFAHAIDRFMPLLHNYYTQGGSWQEHGVDIGRVVQRVAGIAEGAAPVWSCVERLLHDAVANGYLAPAPAPKE
jgi:putative hydrolases of HD superfamily